MADNVTLPGTGAVVATDDDGSAQHQYVKIEFGPDNTQTKVTAGAIANGLPVQALDGALATVGTTTDADSTNTVIGRLKQIITTLQARLPAALTGGGGVKVGLVDALPAGTNAIGKLAANSGVDIGDVDVTSYPGDPSATLYAGTNALTTTEETLAGSQAVSEVLIQADPTNSADVLIGISGTLPIRLGAGGAISLPVNNLNLVYVKMASGTGNVFYLGRD